MEANRLEFYIKRAKKTRYDRDAKRYIRPTDEELKIYDDCMDIMFTQTEKPPTFEEADLFVDGHLRRDVFYRASTHLNPSSTPGFPFFDVPSNDQLNLEELYVAVDGLLNNWLTADRDHVKELIRKRDFVQLFKEGVVPVAHIFVKSEPTKKDKIARLIFGVSVLMNVIGRILFGDYLTNVKKSWSTAAHKVGMDFASESGLQQLGGFFKELAKTAELLGCKVSSDDIQGWEYMGRTWAHTSYHRAYLDAAHATAFHRRVAGMYMAVETCQLFMLSDGQVVMLPFYITPSGKVLTHIQNSKERGALAMTDLCFELGITKPKEHPVLSKRPVCATNGDDCNRCMKGSAPSWSSKLGFVHTDVFEEDLLTAFHFSSQLFYWQENGTLQRRPDSLVKGAYNLLCSDESDSAFYDTLLYMVNHPGWRPLMALAESLRRIPGDGDRALEGA